MAKKPVKKKSSAFLKRSTKQFQYGVSNVALFISDAVAPVIKTARGYSVGKGSVVKKDAE